MLPSHNTRLNGILAVAALLLALMALPGSALEVTVTIENLAPENGSFLTPTWLGVHDGSFDLYDLGSPSSPELERIAEDGNAAPLSDAFTALGFADAVAFGPNGPIAPGQSATVTFDLDPSATGEATYLSYASMVIPSNDAFVANGNPRAIPIFDVFGTFVGGSSVVYGGQVRDAGTEVNDEVPTNTAFFGQAAPDTGVVEGGVVSTHPGFLGPLSGGILADPQFVAGDFTAQGYRVARITVTAATDVRVSIENLAPAAGTFLTPVWVGFHDGGFDVFNTGDAASAALERLAEDGNTGPLSEDFAASGNGTVDGTIPGPNGPIAPGETATATFTVRGDSRYVSFTSMVIPSNDAFVGNSNPTAIPVFDGQGRFLEGEYLVVGDRVYDTGTEVNDESPVNTAFFGQSAPDTGVEEDGLVRAHPGFLPPGSGGILDDDMFSAGDFQTRGYRVARVRVTTSGQPSVYLQNGRFRVSATFEVDGESDRALGKALTDESATFTFFGDENVELVLKVLDACTFNDRFWVFSSGLTDVPVEILVEDLESGESRTFASDGGTAFPPILDSDAFATCP
ncbi:MAG: spondin domain-containing protein [Thermoanaerobaculia bacterium]|nr:spondin domain-containing protein [Thermoanaerobaculia bacterium]